MEEIRMTQAEISRADIFSKISQKKLTQRKAAEMLELCERHVRRLYSRFQNTGLTSLVSQKRGKPSNHQLSKSLKARISELITIELYSGFGPTFMCEKLKEIHNIKVSIETTRQIMIQNGVWKAHKKKCHVIHQQRKRRARCGELVQIDGSLHAWFEDRDEKCALIPFIDDATGKTFGRFFPSETTLAYMIVLKEYILKYGIPLALYSDKHGIFRINAPNCVKKEALTQFGRACKELGIELICANTPQAKGRVERANQTHQDRLIKEMRIAKIINIKGGNKFLDTYWDQHNTKFSVPPANNNDAHRAIPSGMDLDKILCEKYLRKISKNFEIQFDNIIYQLPEGKRPQGIFKAEITVIKKLDGSISFEYKGKGLPFVNFSKQVYNGKEVGSKELDNIFQKRKKVIPSKNHPWRQQVHNKARQQQCCQ